MNFTSQFLREASEILGRLDSAAIDRAVAILVDTRNSQGRLFILGVGGSAANASHAVNDFRKIAALESYAPTDNVSILTARTNDEGWASVFEGWLCVSRLAARDTVLVFSVGGGDADGSQPEPCGCLAIRETGGRAGNRHRRPGRRIRCEGGGCVRDHPHCQPRSHHASCRGV